MDREYLVNQLMKIAKQNGVEIDAEVLGMIVNKSVFRVVAKGGILQNVGEETKTAALVLNGICRAYYVDGNDITRGFRFRELFVWMKDCLVTERALLLGKP